MSTDADRIDQLTAELAEARADFNGSQVSGQAWRQNYTDERAAHERTKAELKEKDDRIALLEGVVDRYRDAYERLKDERDAYSDKFHAATGLIDRLRGEGAQMEHVAERAEDLYSKAAQLKDEMRVERDAALAEAAALLDWCKAWLIRARLAVYREGWEEGMSADEAADALTSVLANLGCDDGTERHDDIAETKRLLAMPITYKPPAGRALAARVPLWRELETITRDYGHLKKCQCRICKVSAPTGRARRESRNTVKRPPRLERDGNVFLVIDQGTGRELARIEVPADATREDIVKVAEMLLGEARARDEKDPTNGK